MFYVRVLIGSIILLSCIAFTTFLIPWIIYSSEWRLEQDSTQKLFMSQLKWEQSRMTLSDQVTKVLKSQKLPKTEIEGELRMIASYMRYYISVDIIVRYLDTYHPDAESELLFLSEKTYWTYTSSIWFVICQIMSLQSTREMKIYSVVTHLLALYYKLLGPSVAVLIIASMGATITWTFTMMLPCVLKMPKDLTQCLTSAYQKRLMARDLIVMLSLNNTGASFYTTHSGIDLGTALMNMFTMMSLTMISANEMYSYGNRNSIMEVLYWTSLLFLANSGLAAAFASIIRAYCTWLSSDEVIATPKELLESLEKEKKERKNQLVYHDKSE